ncbi:MAG: MBL fold metallo-hydrolase [Clostridia bacterium]|nr:MBL fold metallo-hydrolase [Clostridia bacterium]
MNEEFEKRSKSAIKGWITRRAKQKAKKATEKALKGWDTRRENQAKEEARAEKASQTAKKGWETRRENQEKANKKVKKSTSNVWLNIFVSILAFVIGFAGVAFGFCHFTKPTNDVYVSGNLAFHFLELGNEYTGDSTYIKAGDVDILIDAGSRYGSASTIANYIDDYVTDGKLEYVIATHAHQDHIAAFCDAGSNGGGILSRFDIGTIIEFTQTTKTDEPTDDPDDITAVYLNYVAARDSAVAKGAVVYDALECYNNQNGAKRVYELTDNIKMEILYNYYYDHITDDENDYSVCVMFHHGDDKHFLMTGDLEEHGEEHLVEYYAANHGGLPECVLYKGGHHGSKTSSTTALMEAISPEFICVCCCAGTTEFGANVGNEFPTQAFIDRIAPHTHKVFVTSIYPDIQALHPTWTMNGNITVTSSKQGIEVHGSNNDTFLKDTDWFRAHRTMPAAWAAMG